MRDRRLEKLTKGPWVVTREDGYGHAIYGKDGEVVAMNIRGTVDARLLASAPDLLQALKGLVVDTCHLRPLEFKARLDFAEAVILKATGGDK